MNSEQLELTSGQRIRRFLKRLIFTIFVVILALFVYLVLYPCQLPTKYAVGKIDTGFNLSSDQAKKDAIEAEIRWEKAVGKDVFTYDDNATLKIDFVYTDTQAKTNDLLTKLGQYNIATSELKTLGAQLDTEKASYESELGAYNIKTQKHNDAVAAANTQSYSQATVSRLNSDKVSLDSTLKILNNRKAILDQKVEVYNQKVSIQNQYSDQYNSTASSEKGQSFVAGLHLGNFFNHHISIYTYENDEQLTELMMHEMGHEFIHQHASQPESIMYWQMNDKQNGQPSTEDVNLFCTLCRVKK